MAKTTYLKDKHLNDLFRSDATTGATGPDVFIGLRSGGVEVTGTGYARVAVDTSPTAWAAPAVGPTADERRISNAAVIDFGTAGSDWAPSTAPIDEIIVADAATAGNILYSVNRDKAGAAFSVVIQNGNPVQIAAGDLIIFEKDPA